MKNILLLVFICLSAWTSPAYSQTDFRAGLEKADPVDRQSTLSLQEKVKIHRQFYETALAANNRLHQIYGQLYLTMDYLKDQDYAESTRYLLLAEGIAKAENNPGWQGWVMYKKGSISIRMKQYEESLKNYETAAALCGAAGDSLCLAESLEQVSIMYAMLDDFEKARAVNGLAMPLLKKFGGDKQMATALNNFGSINSLQKRPAEAIPYFERSMEIYRKLDNPKDETKARNNLADVYRKLKQYAHALQLFEQCIKINTANNWSENLIRNYIGIGLTYRDMGDFEHALHYLGDYQSLKDSLTGADTQRKIAELEVEFATQQKELELEKSKSELSAAQRSLERGVGLMIFILTLIAFGLWRWRLEAQKAKSDLARNQENLSDLTRILLEKKLWLADLEEKLQSQAGNNLKTTDTDELDNSLYSQYILTDTDWSSFKTYFEKAFPNYMHRLRISFPAITDAEERLFVLIKIKLTTKESATMLGISADSVKKTRNRLRKKLELEKNVSLEDFIRQF